MSGFKRFFLAVLLALSFTAQQAAAAAPYHDHRGREGREHRRITGTALNDVGFLVALASGVSTYLLVRRRASHK